MLKTIPYILMSIGTAIITYVTAINPYTIYRLFEQMFSIVQTKCS